VQLQARPARPFSTTHTVKCCCGELARLSVAGPSDGGELAVAHERYRIRRAPANAGGFVLEGPEGVLATARAGSGPRCQEVAYSGRRLTVEPAASRRRTYVVLEGVALRGSVRRRRPPFLRGLEADLGPEVPLAVQLFIAWLMLAPQNHL
jgi:hypothetical protein